MKQKEKNRLREKLQGLDSPAMGDFSAIYPRKQKWASNWIDDNAHAGLRGKLLFK